MSERRSEDRSGPSEEPRAVAERWIAAVNGHDLDTATGCFAVEYRDEAPARRGELVEGRAAVRLNFGELFAQLPDLEAEMLRSVVDGDTLWMEWRMRGTRRDGTVMEFVGVNILEVVSGSFDRGWIYTELVRDAGGIDAQVERMTRGTE